MNLVGPMVLMAALATAGQAVGQTRELPEWVRVVQVHGFVDTYYAFNFNRPVDGASFIPGTGTTARRSNEFGLNLAALDLTVERAPVGARLTLAFGSGVEVLHAGEPSAAATGLAVLRNILTASVSYAVPLLEGLVVEAGKFPSHIGFEVMASKDNWNYTRAWVAELSPYYLAGIKASYGFLEHVTAQVLLVNGWQNVGENNLPKSLGTSLAWSSERLTVSWNSLVGSELPGERNTFGPQFPGLDTRPRVFNDFVLVLRPLEIIQFAVQADVGYQHFDRAVHQVWHGAAGYVRMVAAPFLAVALRGGYFVDPGNAISGAEQILAAGTVTLELTPAGFIIFKLEGRADASTKPVFTLNDRDGAGAPRLGQTQTLLVGSALVHF